MNQIEYYFDSEIIRNLFSDCISLLSAELSSAQTMNLNNVVNIVESEHDDSEYSDDQILVTQSNIRELIENIYEEFNVDPADLFISKALIVDRIKTEFEAACNENEPSRKFDFSFNIDKDSQKEALFTVLFADINIMNPGCGVEEYSELSNHNFEIFYDAINDVLSSDKNVISFESDHVGGDENNLDLYYNIEFNVYHDVVCIKIALESLGQISDSDAKRFCELMTEKLGCRVEISDSNESKICYANSVYTETTIDSFDDYPHLSCIFDECLESL